MKKLVIITCLFILCACAKAEGESNVADSQPANITPAQQAPEEKKTPAPTAPSESPATLEKKASKPKTIKKELLSLDDWVVGQSYSNVKNRIPKNATVEHDPIWGEYAVQFEHGSLSFDEDGQLVFVLIDSPGKGLSNGLKIGDDEGKITEILGKPTDLTQEVDYNAYSFDLNDTRIDIYTNANKVDDIRLLYTGKNSVNDADGILAFYQQKTQVTTPTPPDPTPIAPEAPEKAPVQQDEPKAITFDEYVKISDDLLNALVQYTQTMSKDITDKEKIKKLQEIDSKYKIYDLSMMFENAMPADEQDSDLHMRCKMLVDKLDSLFGTGQFYLSMKINEDDPKNVAAWEKQAREELQDVWTWVNQL